MAITQDKKTITRQQLAVLKRLEAEEIAIANAAAALALRKEENRKALLELGSPFVDDTTRTVAPGFEIKRTSDVEMDEEIALQFATSDSVFMAAASMLDVHSDCVGMLIGLTRNIADMLAVLAELPDTDETKRLRGMLSAINFQNVFSLNKAGYKKAFKAKRFNNMPGALVENELVAITVGALKIGDDLDGFFEIVEDEPEHAR